MVVLVYVVVVTVGKRQVVNLIGCQDLIQLGHYVLTYSSLLVPTLSEEVLPPTA